MALFNSTQARIKQIHDITQRYYEIGNQSKCYRAVWKNYIYPQFGICYRTYLNYINTPPQSTATN